MQTPQSQWDRHGTARVQYVFVDVVGFTDHRSAEAQSDVVRALNDIVRKAIAAQIEPSEKQVLIPTGDGIAVALINASDFDIHLKIGLEILKLASEHNAKEERTDRRFQLRVGVNENIDNVIMDINDRVNVAGAGISMAQRIMDQAGNHSYWSARRFMTS